MTTIADIYAAINPLPAMLMAKGKIKPEVSLVIEANAGFAISMNWDKRHAKYSYERDYKTFLGASFEEALGKAATAFRERHHLSAGAGMTENRIEMWLCIVGFGLCMRIFETRPEYMEKKNAEARARYWRNKSNAS